MKYFAVANCDHKRFVEDTRACKRQAARKELRLVWCTHVFVLPTFYHVVIEHAFVPQTVDGILGLLGKILTEQSTNITQFTL